MQDLTEEIADAAGDNVENARYFLAAFLQVVASHLVLGDAIGLKSVGSLVPGPDGIDFISSKVLLREIRHTASRSRE